MGILGENGALQLIECLTWSVSFDIFMDNISHLFICLSTLKLTTLEQHLRSTKICYANALSLGTNGCKKRNVATLNSANQAKKQCNFDSGWSEWQQCNLHSFFLNLVNLRDLFGVKTKLKKNIFKNNNQISSTVITRAWVLSTEWNRTWLSIGILIKKWRYFPFVWMVNVVIQGAWVLYRISKNKGD